jgi:hypothetical protein
LAAEGEAVAGHLIHVGFPKAGSTFLQRWFSAHPDIAYREGAIAGFGSVYRIAREAAAPGPEPRWRATSSELLTAPRPRAKREAPSEAGEERMAERQERAADMLADIFPGATILIVTRGFRSMILSSYSQHVRQGGTEPIELLMAGAGRYHPWHYDRVVSAYRSRFGRDKVILLPYELLARDSAAFLEALAGRLGIDPGPMPAGRVNPSLAPHELAWYPRLAAAARRLPPLARPLRRASMNNRLRRPIALLQRVWPKPPVTEALVPDAVVESFRGSAVSLRAEPLYASFAADYLL